MKSLQEENIQKIFLLSQCLQCNHTVRYVARTSSTLFKHQLVSSQNFETVKDFRYQAVKFPKLSSVFCNSNIKKGFPDGSVVKNPLALSGNAGLIPGSGRSPEKKMATQSSILALEISRTEEPAELQSRGSQKNGTRLSD